MSDTPRTNNFEGNYQKTELATKFKAALVHARQLERELNEARLQLSAYSLNPDRIGQTEIAMARTANSTLAEALAERDKLERQRNKGLETIASLAGERDELKAHNEMLVEALQQYAYIQINLTIPEWINLRDAALNKSQELLSEITLRNRKAKALDELKAMLTETISKLESRGLNDGYVYSIAKEVLEAIEAATKKTK